MILPSVTHPGGRHKAFTDAFKAMVRFMIEVNDNPTIAYAIDKTDRIVTEENRKLLSEEDLAQWDAACDEFDSMSDVEQDEWIENVDLTVQLGESTLELALFEPGEFAQPHVEDRVGLDIRQPEAVL